MSKKFKDVSSVLQNENAQSGVMDLPAPSETASLEAMITELREELAAKARLQKALSLLSHQALSDLSLPQFFSSAVNQVVQALSIDACRLLVSAFGTDWILQVACGWPDVAPDVVLSPDQGALAWVALHCSPVVVMLDRATENRCHLGPDYQPIQSAAAIAIPGAQGCWGVLEVGSFQQCVFRPDALDFLQSVANLLSDVVQANDRLVESREMDDQMRLAMNLSQDGVFDWHISNNEVYWDLRLYEMLGLFKKQAFLSVEEVLTLLHPDDRAVFSEFIAVCLKQSHPCEREFRVRHGSGNYRILRLRGNVVLGSQGQPFRLVGLLTDVTEIREALLREQESESRFMAMADVVPVLICICDETGQAVYYNRACQEFAGVSSEELLDKSWIHWVHPDDRQKLIDIYTSAIPQHALFNFEYRVIRHDGLVRYLMNTGAPRLQSDGRFVGYVIVAVDVTEERKASARIQRIMDANLAGILYIRLDGQILDCNEAFLEMTGYSREELKQEVDLWTLTPPEYVHLCTSAIQQLKETDACEPFEKQYIRKDGTRLDVLLTATRLVEEDPDIAVTMVFDISARKQAQRALEKSYNLIHIISQAQTQFITSGDNWEMFRELLNRLLAYTESEYGFIGQVLHDPDGNPYLKTHFLNDISWDESTHKLYEDNIATGLEFHNLKTLFGQVMVTGKPVFANDPTHDPRRGGLPEGHPALNAFLGLPLYKGDDLVGMIGLSNRSGGYDEALADDLLPYLVACANIIVGVRNEALRERLTQDLRLSEHNLKSYASRLEQSNSELEQFATIASHDLQAPLRKVMVFSEFLRTALGDNLNAECLDYLDRIQKATDKMQSLITDLLALSRVNRKGKPFIPVDLMAITQDVLSDLEETIQETGAQVLIGDMMTIDADGLQMQQVLQNLLGNALKFHKPGIPPKIEISAVPLSDALCQIRVRDNGIGFDEKYLDRIFTIFERLHGEQEYSGTGMGLAIVKKIVGRHYGEVTARSKPGEGATFIITLPIHPS